MLFLFACGKIGLVLLGEFIRNDLDVALRVDPLHDDGVMRALRGAATSVNGIRQRDGLEVDPEQAVIDVEVQSHRIGGGEANPKAKAGAVVGIEGANAARDTFEASERQRESLGAEQSGAIELVAKGRFDVCRCADSRGTRSPQLERSLDGLLEQPGEATADGRTKLGKLHDEIAILLAAQHE
jgi:hypothetical protein